MSATRSRDWDNGDVLQGIMETRMVPTPSPVELSSDGLTAPSDLALGDPTSLLGLQFGSDPAAFSRNHTSILGHWLSYNNQSPPSPRTRPLDYPQYHVPRISVSSDQDAWNPLQITGVPAAFGMQHMGKPSHMGDMDGRYSHYQYSTPSETGSQYNGLQPSDSGYGSKSCATRSVIDQVCSPKAAPREQEHEQGGLFDHAPVKYGEEAGDSMEKMESSSLMGQDSIHCDYPGCRWTGKCPSDKKKHEARHKKLFKCDEPGCTRKEGFGTINDLARHKKCVHKQEPERGPKVLYMCFGQNCPRRNKKWPRLDNFKQHLARMHNDESAEDLLRKSKEWYEKCVKPQEVAPSLVDRFSQEEPEFQTHLVPESDYMTMKTDCDQESCNNSIAPDQTVIQPDPIRSSESLTLNPIKILDDDEDEDDDDHHHHVLSQSLAQPLLAGSQTVELPGLKSLNLPPTLDQIPSSSSMTSQLGGTKHDKMEDIVSEAAGNMINALTKIMNSNQRRRSQGEDGEDMMDQGTELCDRKREMLQRILSAALDKLSTPSGSTQVSLSGASDPILDKKDWIQCDRCPKRTRLRCEMKKHKKRHDRPYGCTFHKCNKTFGSKADWKRHENSQHFHLQSWRCTLPDSTQKDDDLPCARLFYRQEIYVQHLRKHHQVSEDEVQTGLSRNRIGRNGQSQFWCGFCRGIIPLKTQGLAAWNERFNHIDTEHFKKGERIGDWLPPSGHLTKRREREQEKQQRMVNGNELGEENSDDDDTESSSCCMSEDEMSQDPAEKLSFEHCDSHSASISYSPSEATIPQKRKYAAPHPPQNPPRQRSRTEGASTGKKPKGKAPMLNSDPVYQQAMSASQDPTTESAGFIPAKNTRPEQGQTFFNCVGLPSSDDGCISRADEDDTVSVSAGSVFAGLHGPMSLLPPYLV
ncbi:hypothetical protein ASPWEDRAFT_175157 [Aspergillus wentii DTO 134E9]|uniref:C2H2-type domain-containing protein n=1 Tax=Aspergillus wentii DTO 134E9 TaxID=1073089 RepID=A0A1L9RAB0_ASPWE|nr:uncharacterized protein ASPWEDRAFT_175157 [Aspergillus wentii DTO 134E9]KAI9934428.1 hypothetical protein MW887_000042 [Aspergillus wentii]OJJ31839.1 hypothetical protein ASPWEDRAFT_175157 [Aspergillus wentii DTO 134E9]